MLPLTDAKITKWGIRCNGCEVMEQNFAGDYENKWHNFRVPSGYPGYHTPHFDSHSFESVLRTWSVSLCFNLPRTLKFVFKFTYHLFPTFMFIFWSGLPMNDSVLSPVMNFLMNARQLSVSSLCFSEDHSLYELEDFFWKESNGFFPVFPCFMPCLPHLTPLWVLFKPQRPTSLIFFKEVNVFIYWKW